MIVRATSDEKCWFLKTLLKSLVGQVLHAALPNSVDFDDG